MHLLSISITDFSKYIKKYSIKTKLLAQKEIKKLMMIKDVSLENNIKREKKYDMV